MQRHMAGECTFPEVLKFKRVGDIGAGFAGCCTNSTGLLLPTSCPAAPCTIDDAWVDTSMHTSQKAR